MSRRPLAIDLCCGLGGWTKGLLAAGYDVIGYDIEEHIYEEDRYPAWLILKDIRDMHGADISDADLIVASPPCQEYSYMAMPFSRGKAKATAIRADETGEARRKLTELFDTCFRLQEEASAAKGKRIPMLVENVRGANPWVGKAPYHFGSFWLWGDIPSVMPKPKKVMKNIDGGSWFGINPDGSPGALNNPRDGRKVPGFRFDGSSRSFQSASVAGSKSPNRKAASAKIAEIPFVLSEWVGLWFLLNS